MQNLKNISIPSICDFWTNFQYFQTQGIAVPTEDLTDEYYTVIFKPNDNFIPQDETDAQAIINSNRKEETIASILSYHDKFRRYAIQQRMLTKIEPSVGIVRIFTHTIKYIEKCFKITQLRVCAENMKYLSNYIRFAVIEARITHHALLGG